MKLLTLAIAGTLAGDPDFAEQLTPEVASVLIPCLALEYGENLSPPEPRSEIGNLRSGPADLRSAALQLFVVIAKRYPEVAGRVFSDEVRHPSGTMARNWQAWNEAVCRALDEAGIRV